MSLSHLQLAQSMREEAKKLEEFREKQKDARKKVCGLRCAEVMMTPNASHEELVTRRGRVVSDRTADGRPAQTESFTVQEDNGCE